MLLHGFLGKKREESSWLRMTPHFLLMKYYSIDGVLTITVRRAVQCLTREIFKDSGQAFETWVPESGHPRFLSQG